MSWLLLDVGNTALKWALLPAAGAQWPGAEADGAGSPARRGALTLAAPDFAAALALVCDRARAAEAVIFGCAVAAEGVLSTIDREIAKAGLPAVHWFGAQRRFDHDGIVVSNIYEDAGQLGADRWHALIGARAHFPQGALVVVNAGTATTVDALSADGHFLGGVIVPGLELMRASLARATARLPLAAGVLVAHPANTDDAINTGILECQAGLIERRVRRVREATHSALQLLVCGGSGPALMPLLQGNGACAGVLLQSDLVLRGLWHAARAHQGLVRGPVDP